MITPNEYLDNIWGLFNPAIKNHQDKNVPLLYLLTKLHIELIELDEASIKYNEFTKPYDQIKRSNQLLEELGDIIWYIGNLLTLTNKQDIFIDFINNYPSVDLYDLSLNHRQLIIESSHVLQNLIKSIYHDKPEKFSIDQLITLINNIGSQLCTNDGQYTINDILEKNIDKLYNRYGKSYESKSCNNS